MKKLFRNEKFCFCFAEFASYLTKKQRNIPFYSYSESRNATVVGDGLTLQYKPVQKICLMIEL